MQGAPLPDYREHVEITGDARDYERALQGASATTRTATQSWGDQLKRFGGVVKGVLAVEAVRYVAEFTVSLAEAASATVEALNKVDVTFGASASKVEAYADTAARAAGISKTAALQAAGGFGVMLQTAGLAVDEAADMSIALVQLAGDIASFNDIDPSEALEKLRSGLAGEAEPLRTVGVLLSEERVKEEAWAAGIAKRGAELTEQQKVLARYNVILKDTSLQQEDFARTSDSLANRQRTVNALWEDAKARIGQAIVPAMQSLLDLLEGAIPVLEFLAEHITAIGAAFATWLIITKVGPLLATLGMNIGATVAEMMMGERAALGLRAAINANISALNAWAVAAGLVVAAAIDVWKYLKLDDEQAKSWTDQILAGEASLQDYRKAVADVTGESGLSDMWNGDRQVLSALEQTTEQVKAAIRAQNEEVLAGNPLYERYRDGLDSVQNSSLQLHGELAALLASMGEWHIELTKAEDDAFRQALAEGDLGRAIDILKGKLGIATSFEEDLAGAHRETAKAAREERRAELELAGGLLGLISSVRSVNEAQATLADLHRQGKQGTAEYRDAELDLLESQQSLLASFADYRDELQESGSSQDDIKRKLFEMGRQVGLTRGEVSRLIRELGIYGRQLDNLPDRKVTEVVTVFRSVHVGAEGGPGSRQQLATGGIVRAARGLIARSPALLVGEGNYLTPFGRGAEGVIPFDSRGIGILAKALGMALDRDGGRRGDVHLHIHGDVFPRDGRAFGEDVVAVIRREVLREAR